MSLSLILGLLCPALSHTDIWRSPQVGGPDLFTYWRKDPRTCQKYETGLAINFVPSSPTTTLSEWFHTSQCQWRNRPLSFQP